LEKSIAGRRQDVAIPNVGYNSKVPEDSVGMMQDRKTLHHL
jgi:hypothetical protein